jgi:predicted nucleic acid-binding protein
MHEKRIPQYCKMMKLLSRRELLKELYSKLNKLVTKTRIEEEEEEYKKRN